LLQHGGSSRRRRLPGEGGGGEAGDVVCDGTTVSYGAQFGPFPPTACGEYKVSKWRLICRVQPVGLMAFVWAVCVRVGKGATERGVYITTKTSKEKRRALGRNAVVLGKRQMSRQGGHDSNRQIYGLRVQPINWASTVWPPLVVATMFGVLFFHAVQCRAVPCCAGRPPCYCCAHHKTWAYSSSIQQYQHNSQRMPRCCSIPHCRRPSAAAATASCMECDLDICC
jgi:hypothetical protein